MSIIMKIPQFPAVLQYKFSWIENICYVRRKIIIWDCVFIKYEINAFILME